MPQGPRQDAATQLWRTAAEALPVASPTLFRCCCAAQRTEEVMLDNWTSDAWAAWVQRPPTARQAGGPQDHSDSVGNDAGRLWGGRIMRPRCGPTPLGASLETACVPGSLAPSLEVRCGPSPMCQSHDLVACEASATDEVSEVEKNVE